MCNSFVVGVGGGGGSDDDDDDEGKKEGEFQWQHIAYSCQ